MKRNTTRKQKGGILQLQQIFDLEGFNMDPRHILCSTFAFNNKQDIDYDWISRQIAYLNSLSEREKYIVYSYTVNGDKFINSYLRGTLTSDYANTLLDAAIRHSENPFRYQHEDTTTKSDIDSLYRSNIIEYVKQFIEELKRIIGQSPRLTRQIKVYRGITNGLHLTDTSDKICIVNQEFISTTIYVGSAVMCMMKANSSNNATITSATELGGRLLELTIGPNAPCLFTAHLSRRRMEFEITLCPGMLMIMTECKWKYIFSEPEQYEADTFIEPDRKGLHRTLVCGFNVSSVINTYQFL